MKKFRDLIVLIALANGMDVAGQANGLFDMGLKGGLNRDDLSSSYTHTPILGGHFGMFARLKPPVLPGVQGELLLSSMGTSTEVQGVHAEIRSLDLQLPVFGILAFGPAEFHLGGYYSHHFARRLIADLDLDIDVAEVGIENLREGTFGLLVGAGLRVRHFYAGLRYNHGLDAIGSGPYLGEVRNRQYQAYIGFGFFK